jgi:hypothetical protein
MTSPALKAYKVGPSGFVFVAADGAEITYREGDTVCMESAPNGADLHDTGYVLQDGKMIQSPANKMRTAPENKSNG